MNGDADPLAGRKAPPYERGGQGAPPHGRRPALYGPASSFMDGAWRVFELSLGEMLWSRRTIFMAVIVAGPVLLAIVARLVQAMGIAPLRVEGVGVGGGVIFGTIIWGPFLRFIVPVLGVFYGTSLIADEVEDKTITYLFTRPIRRGAVLVGKYLTYLVCTTLVVLPSVMIVYFIIVPFRGIPASFTSLVTDLGVLALGLAAYGAVFALIGAAMKRPLISGLVFVIGWEPFAQLMPGSLHWFTVAQYLHWLMPHAMPSDGAVALLKPLLARAPSPVTSVFLLLVILGVALGLATRVTESREYVLEQ